MDIKRGDIFWIKTNPYRETFGSMQKQNRPAIIVSNNSNNLHSDTFEIVYLTRAPKKELPTHCTIRSTEDTSTALCEQVTTVSFEQLGNYIASCTSAEMECVNRCIAISLGIYDTLKAHSAEEPQSVQKEEATAEPQQKEADKGLLLELIRTQERLKVMEELHNDLLQRIINS